MVPSERTQRKLKLQLKAITSDLVHEFMSLTGFILVNKFSVSCIVLFFPGLAGLIDFVYFYLVLMHFYIIFWYFGFWRTKTFCNPSYLMPSTPHQLKQRVSSCCYISSILNVTTVTLSQTGCLHTRLHCNYRSCDRQQVTPCGQLTDKKSSISWLNMPALIPAEFYL